MATVSHGLDRVPDCLGSLVLNEDGAVVTSAGDLENDEKLADQLMRLVRAAVKTSAVGERPGNFKQLSVIWKTYMYMITISNHRVFIVKRQNNPQEPVSV